MSPNLQITFSDLNNLVIRMGAPEIPSVDALMLTLFGRKRTAKDIFLRLIYWMPKAKRKDGYVYKSAAEMAREITCSPKSVERARPLLQAIGFDLKKWKAEGSPTIHFRLDIEKFLSVLSDRLGHSVEQLKAWIWSKREGTSLQKRDEMSESIPPQMSESTTPPRPEPFDPDVQNHLIKMSESNKSKTPYNDSTDIRTQRIGTTGIDSFLKQEVNAALLGYRPQYPEGMSRGDLMAELDVLARHMGTTSSNASYWYSWIGLINLRKVAQEARQRAFDGRVHNAGGWSRRTVEIIAAKFNMPRPGSR